MKKASWVVLAVGFVAAWYWSVIFAADPVPPTPQPAKNAVQGTQIQIDCQVKITNKAGKTTVASPKLIVVSGQPAKIQIGEENGESLEIQLTGTLLDPAAPPANARKSETR